MSLSSRLNTPPDRISGADCSVGILLRTLDGAELDALVAMLGTHENRGWSQAEIYEALTAEGYKVGHQTINRHRARACRCFRIAA